MAAVRRRRRDPDRPWILPHRHASGPLSGLVRAPRWGPSRSWACRGRSDVSPMAAAQMHDRWAEVGRRANLGSTPADSPSSYRVIRARRQEEPRPAMILVCPRCPDAPLGSRASRSRHRGPSTVRPAPFRYPPCRGIATSGPEDVPRTSGPRLAVVVMGRRRRGETAASPRHPPRGTTPGRGRSAQWLARRRATPAEKKTDLATRRGTSLATRQRSSSAATCDRRRGCSRVGLDGLQVMKVDSRSSSWPWRSAKRATSGRVIQRRSSRRPARRNTEPVTNTEPQKVSRNPRGSAHRAARSTRERASRANPIMT